MSGRGGAVAGPRQPGGRKRDSRVIFGAVVAGLFVVCGVFAPVLSPHSPVRQDYDAQLRPPAPPYLLGTDDFGRDILSRLLWGSRISLAVAAGAVVLGVALGAPLGTAAAYYGGGADLVLMRLTDLIMAFPAILLAIAMVAFFGPGVSQLILIIGIVQFPRFARLAYATTQAEKNGMVVEASRALGADDRRILWTVVAPALRSSILVQASLSAGFAILLESGLSFIGVGAQPPTPSWGVMIAEARQVMAHSPFYMLWPCCAVALTILSFNLMGDGLRDVLDPRLRR